MFGRTFELNEHTMQIVEQIGAHMPGGFFIYRAEAPEELLYANAATLDIFGCATLDEFRELTGFTFRGMLHPEDYQAISDSIVEQIGSSDDNMDYVEYRIVRRDGSVRWVDDYGHYTETDAYGGIYYVFISDITEKRERMETDREVRLAVIEALSKAYELVWLINDVETESFALYRGATGDESEHDAPVREALRRMRYTQAKESYIETYVAPEDRERLQEELALANIVLRLRERPQYAVGYRRLLDTSGQGGGAPAVRHYRIEFAKVDMPGGKMGVVCGFRDVDDEVRKEQSIQQALREAVEAANASNKAKSDFLSSMSHDIRTPMNGIIGMTAIAATHLDDRDRVADCLRKITEASSHLLSLINEVLDMNKIESGKMDLAEEEFDIPELVDGLLSMTHTQVERHGHELTVRISDVTHEKVIGDSRRLQQVFVNLMSNAIKYTPDGGRISLSISERPSGVAGIGCYEFVFEDNGIGMTEEFLGHLFEPFSRAEDRRSVDVQGTGLGMTITRNIVRMMGGDVQVESVYGLGSKFTVTLYLRLQDTEPEDLASFANLHVLVADDDPLSCESACGILNDLGMNSEWVLSGKAAVDRVKVRHDQGRDFYAVIIDWKMPDMNGVETCRRIRAVIGDDVPIIIFSAYDWTDIEEEARHAGASAFISKPLFKTKLVRTFQALAEDAPEEPAGEPLRSLDELDFGGRLVLLAEDNPINAEIAMSILQMANLNIEWAKDGEQAVRMFGESVPGTYALVLMDIQMPRMNGYEATRAIRALRRADAAAVPIVALTANAFEDDRLRARQAGMNAHIAKPLDFDELAAVLQRLIGA